jgi:Flp pilus assembly protein TadG
MTSSKGPRRHERGAVLVHVALILVAMLAFIAVAVDYGVLFASRRQAQNAADAAALAAATSLTFVNSTNFGLAQSSAVAAANQNTIWGQTPDVLAADVTRVTPCPPGAPGVPDTCVRTDVFRTNYQRANGSPLPTFFANLVGVNQQGTRASATAQMLASDATADCVKPWGLPDRWIENRGQPDEFDRYQRTGSNRGQLMSAPPALDAYDPALGYVLPRDYGVLVRLYVGGNGNQAIEPGFFQPVVINPGYFGANRYQQAIEGCVTTPIGPGMVLQPEPGRMVGPTSHGFENLIDLDPTARWDPSANGGLGAPTGGCMAAGTCSRSPRWIAVPVFNIDTYEQARTGVAPGPGDGRNSPINVVRIIGLWLDERRPGNDINAYITHYPTISLTGALNNPAGFARTVSLVR